MYNWKGYKAVSPNETIERIRQILSKNGIQTECRKFGKDGICSSVRVILSDNKLGRLDIGTNGKGMNEDYAVASAYAEFMERLQNKMLIFTSKYASPLFRTNNPALVDNYPEALSFRYFPDEEYRRIDNIELCHMAHKFLPGNILFGDSSLKAFYDMPFLPFYNVRKREVEQLPYDLIRFAAGSTGLCAGNTAEEAMLQGLNEIFERYVLQQIYLRHPLLPKVDFSYFNGSDIGESLTRLNKLTGWEFEIMDCSLGGLFPVMGLYIANKEERTYTFRLGADYSPAIALQRCLTEIFQGTDIDNSPFLPMESMNSNWNISEEFRKNVINGRGQFPPEILQGKQIPSPFIILDKKPTIKDTFYSAIQWLDNNGYTLYVRDNSFLSFPSYHLYIPGLSDVNHSLYNIRRDILSIEQYYGIKKEYRIKSLSANEIKTLINQYRSDSTTHIMLFDYLPPRHNRINKNLLLALLAFKVHDCDAHTYMSAFLNDMEARNIRLNPYYYCLKDYMSLAYSNTPSENIRQELLNNYHEETVNDVLKIIPENILDGLPLPDCFNCSSCSFSCECFYSQIIEFEARTQKHQTENPINQSSLNLFYDYPQRHPSVTCQA